MRIGYARVWTEDQKLNLWPCALIAAGYEKIFDEQVCGSSPRLPAREEMLEYARAGDVAVVWKLDRLGRSLRDLVDVVLRLKGCGVGLCSLHESIDTTTAASKLTFHVFAALAECQADGLVREQTRAGLAAVRSRGAKLGRSRSLSSDQVEMARTLLANPSLSARQVAAQLGVHRATLYCYLARPG